MFLTVNKEHLSNDLSLVAPLALAQQKENAFIRLVAADRLIMSAVNMVHSEHIEIVSESEVTKHGHATLAAARFKAGIDAAPTGELTIEKNGNYLKFKSNGWHDNQNLVEEGYGQYTLRWESPENKIQVQSSVQLRALIERVKDSMSIDPEEKHAAFKSIQLRFLGNKLSVYAGCNHRAASAEYNFGGSTFGDQEQVVIIPKRAVETILVLLKSDDVPVTLGSTGRALTVELGNIKYSTAELAVQVVNFAQFFTLNESRRIKINGPELLKCLKSVEPALGQTALHKNIVAAALTPGKLWLKANEVGEAIGTMPLDYSGETFKFGVNAKYLKDGLKAAEEVEIEYTEPDRPMLFHLLGDTYKTKRVVMPSRLC